ncbi:MAG TPA: DUF664 domain-containing protein [Kribbella sp.]
MDIATEPPVAGSEVDTLLGALERNRRTFAWKCGGLDTAGLTKQHPPSTITLGGLLKHLALVEDEYFTRRLLGQDLGAPWSRLTGTPTRTGSGTARRTTRPRT